MILNDFNLTGKVAIVTGPGQGSDRGWPLAWLRRVQTSLESISTIWARRRKGVEERGRKFLGIEADLSNIKVIESIMNQTIQEFRTMDILINNAGIIRRADTIDFSEKDWDDVMNVNLKTVFFFSQAVAKQFIKQKTGGKIINVASMLSFQGGIRVPSYTASKSGVMGITRLMANEWAKYNINVNAIAPGYMATDNTAPIREDPKRSKAILERIPAGRWGLPDDLKGIAVFLASEASSYINGYTIAVDGGWLAR